MGVSSRWTVGALACASLVCMAIGACVGDDPTTSVASDASVDGEASDASSGGDALTSSDAGPDVDRECDPTAAFGSPVAVAGLPTVNSVARFSPDELTAYFAWDNDNDAGIFHLYEASRASRSASFGTPVALAAVNDDAGESDPAVSVDGLDLVYVHGYQTPMASNRDLWWSIRNDAAAPFPAGSIIPNVNSGSNQDDYVFQATNHDLWFVTTAFDGDGGHQIARAAWVGGGYDAPMLVDGVNLTADDQYYPTVTSDQLRIFFARGKVIWTADRTSVSDPFSNASALNDVNGSLTNLRPSWISADGCRLYVSLGAPQTILVATRGK